MRKCGFRRLKSDGNFYVHKGVSVIVLAQVDDLIEFGKPGEVKHIFHE